MIDTGSKSREKVGEESWMFLEVEVERSVVDFEIGRLDDDLFEGVMFLLIRENGKGNTHASTECSIIARTALSNSS